MNRVSQTLMHSNVTGGDILARTVAIILSGGTGNRVGGSVPKQYIEVAGKPVISYCMKTIFSHELIDAVYIVADEIYHDLIGSEIEKLESKGCKKSLFRGFVKPGVTRQMSIYNALVDMESVSGAENIIGYDDVVIIHDAARPLVSKKLLTGCIEAARRHDGVMPAFQVKDTVYVSKDGGTVNSLLNRNEIYAGQAPEAFRFGPYFDANKKLLPDKILSICGSTEPAVLAGLDIVIIEGDEANFKITTQADLKRFKEIMTEK